MICCIYNLEKCTKLKLLFFILLIFSPNFSRKKKKVFSSGRKFLRKMYRAPLVEGSSINKDQNPDNKLKRPSDLQQWGNEAMELSGELNPCSNSVKRQRVTHDQTGLPAISSCSELDKEICGLVAPIVRCPQNGKPSKSCTRKDGTEQDVHLAEGYQPVLPENPVPLEVEEEGGCLRASCCMDVQTARITAQVYASRGSQSIMSGQQELEGNIKGTEQINDSEEANGSPKNEVVTNKQQVRVSEEATEPPSSDISKKISLVETIYSKRIEKLLANQSKKSLQFKEARDRIKNDLTKKLRKEHSNASVLVRKMHPGVEARIVGLKNVDKEFIMKEQVIRTHLNTEQVKLDSIHEADMEEERKLKSHWMHEAKSGRSVDGYSILPQFLDSCFNLDDLKNCEQVHLVEGTVSHSLQEMGVAGHSEVPRGCSPPVGEGTIPTEPLAAPQMQPQQHPSTLSSSELPLGPLLSILSYNEIPVFSQAEELQISTTPNSPSEPVLLYSSSKDTSFQSYNGFSSNNQSNAAAAPVSSRTRSKQSRGLC
ncbi:hypothetical protein MKW92_035838 [Papaver armeniacum]|nr:hypothetical protein MKW92_035838 [Papaver armeniacum]